MKRICTALTFTLMCAPALAQNQDTGQNTGEAVTAMSVSLEDCQRLVKHTASADVAYKPGVDVRGKAVKPADIKPLGAIELPKEIVIDFGLDLTGRYGIGAASSFDASAGIATIKYDLGSGKLTINGTPLEDADAQAVEAACAMRLENEAGK